MLNRRLTLLTITLIAILFYAFLKTYPHGDELLKKAIPFISIIGLLLGLWINFIITKIIDKKREEENEKAP